MAGVQARRKEFGNVFMTFAWYGHLENLATARWYVAALVSWGIAPYAMIYMDEPLRLDCVWAGLCVLGAAYCKVFCEVCGGYTPAVIFSSFLLTSLYPGAAYAVWQINAA